MGRPYTEGWPRWMPDPNAESRKVVPLSDAERMREALERIASQNPDERGSVPPADLCRIARDALNPERGK